MNNIKCFIFSKPEFKTPDDYRGKLIWKGYISAVPSGCDISINGVIHSVERMSYEVTKDLMEIHLDFKDIHGSYERLDFND